MSTNTRLPAVALDAQLDLLHWYGTDAGNKYADAIGEQMMELSKEISYRVTDHKRDTRVNYDNVGSIMHRVMLTRAETYAVSSEIVDVLEVAAPSIPDYTLHDTDPPTKSGFIYLERPIVIKDIHDNPLVVRAIGWDPIAYSDNIDRIGWAIEPDGAQNSLGEWALLFLLWTDPSDARDHMHDNYVNELSDLSSKYGLKPPQNLWSILGGVWPVGTAPSDNNIVFRFLMTFFRFCQEEWIDSRAIAPDRAAVRRAERRGVPQPRVRVVRLRRRGNHQAAHPDQSGERKLYVNHRGLVRGHWRNQWYPSLQQHRPKWIAEFLKGPDDAPLVIDDKVFHVIR